MKHMKLKNIILTLFLVFVIGSFSSCSKNIGTLNEEVDIAKDMVVNINDSLSTEGAGGVWPVVGFVRGDFQNEERVKDLLESYKIDLISQLKKQNGEIDEDYYSSYERNSIGAKYIGLDPRNIVGYNIVTKIDSRENVEKQGINAVAFALISSNVVGEKLSNEDTYIDIIIKDINDRKLYNDDQASDYVTMSIQGLSYYYDREYVKKAVDLWLDELSNLQKEDGSLGNCESTCELIIALTSLGIDPRKDERFIKDGKTLLDGLYEYKGEDGYLHTKDEDAKYNHLSTEKSFLALLSIKLLDKNEKLFQLMN